MAAEQRSHEDDVLSKAIDDIYSIMSFGKKLLVTHYSAESEGEHRAACTPRGDRRPGAASMVAAAAGGAGGGARIKKQAKSAGADAAAAAAAAASSQIP